MGVLDFLFEGSAPTPATGSSTTQVQLPEWYTQYTTDMLGKAQAVSSLPYAQYTGPRIAGFTPGEKAGFEATKQAAGSYQPFLDQTKTALDQAGQIKTLDAASGDLNRASTMMGATAAQPLLSQSASMSGLKAAEPLFKQAMPSIQQAGQASSLTAAKPFLDTAAKTFPGSVNEYMNPYIEGVVNKIADTGVRQLKEKYLPAIGDEFIRAGQFGVGPGSTRMGEFGARALRDVQESVLSEQAKALQSGYGQAADIFGQDVSRAGQMASTVGSLSAGDLSRMLESGARTADIGAKMGQLTSEDASRIADIGKATGSLTAQDAQLLATIGQTRGSLAGQDAANLKELADRYLRTGQSAQEMGLRGAEAITGVGERERAMQQANLDLAYKDFLEQRDYPKEQIKFLGDALSNVQLPQTTVNTTTQMPAQPGGPSNVQSAIDAAGGISELLKLLKNK